MLNAIAIYCSAQTTHSLQNTSSQPLGEPGHGSESHFIKPHLRSPCMLPVCGNPGTWTCIANRADSTKEVQLEKAFPCRLLLRKIKQSIRTVAETALGNLKTRVSDAGESSRSEKTGQLEIWKQPKIAMKYSLQLGAKLTDICMSSCYSCA